jgi:hypothetical protein
MILPTKHLREQRALITIGAEIITLLRKPRTVNSLWNAIKAEKSQEKRSIPYDWFVLTLDFLYAIDAIDMGDGLIRRREQ